MSLLRQCGLSHLMDTDINLKTAPQQLSNITTKTVDILAPSKSINNHDATHTRYRTTRDASFWHDFLRLCDLTDTRTE